MGSLVVGIVLVSGCVSSSTVDEPDLTAILVPEIASPMLNGEIDPSEWSDAAQLEGAFIIDDGSDASGDFPFRLWLGTSKEALHVAIKVQLPNWSANPLSPENTSYPFFIEMLLSNSESELVVPSDYISVGTLSGYGSSQYDGYWDGTSWVMQKENAPGEFNGGYPNGSARWSFGKIEGSVISIEHYIGRNSPLVEVDGFTLPVGGGFRLALVFQVQGDPLEEEMPFGSHYDVFPGEGHSPDSWKDVRGWIAVRAAS